MYIKPPGLSGLQTKESHERPGMHLLYGCTQSISASCPLLASDAYHIMSGQRMSALQEIIGHREQSQTQQVVTGNTTVPHHSQMPRCRLCNQQSLPADGVLSNQKSAGKVCCCQEICS